MLTRNYDLNKRADVVELYESGPRIFKALMGMAYKHNEMTGRIGVLYQNKKAGGWRFKPLVSGASVDSDGDLAIKGLIDRSRKLMTDINKYCRVLGYMAETKMGNRICGFIPRAQRTGRRVVNRKGRLAAEYGRPGFSVGGFNQKGLFIFATPECEREARDLIVDIILTTDVK